MADGGIAPMTNGVVIPVSEQNLESLAMQMPLTSHPGLVTQHSNSLPSTPYIHARKLSEDARTPSPIAHRTEVTSPRSARSESDTALRPYGRTPFLTGCKYETGMAHSRRRIPYSVGGDMLEKAKSTPKKFLNPIEEGKLSGDMRELYDRLLPSAESEDRRARFTKKLEKILNEQWPDNSIKAHVFGSSGNLLCTDESDVDICITTPMKALERVCLLAKALAEHGMERVVCVPHAKVPIVKIWDPELQLACDLNVNNTLALENTRMIKTYVEIDFRVRPLAMVVKHWTRRRILNDAALGGTLSSYTWICLIINFLQTRHPPVLPCLHQRPHQRLVNSEGQVSAFADDLESLRGFGKSNNESVGELLFHFFRYYAHAIDYENSVVSIREGRLISKQAKKWHLMQNNRLCVEEPFNITRNLGNTADDISFRGVHLELRRAFDLLSIGKLDECCEQYVFPHVEERVWAKPVPQPLPVLRRSHSQTGRTNKTGGSHSRGGHANQRHRAGVSNRRASSAAIHNKPTVLTQGHQGGPVSSTERSAGAQIHDQLYQHYQFLQQQEAQLRLQMHQKAHANIHAHVTAQIQPSMSPGIIFPPQLNMDHLRRQRRVEPAPLSAPLGNMGFYYPSHQSNQPVRNRNTTHQPQASPRTNPSSPLMAHVQPVQVSNGLPELRRSLHRAATTDNNTGTLRSHSQPAASNMPNLRTQSQASRSSAAGWTTPGTPSSLQGISTLQQYQAMYLRAHPPTEMQSNGLQSQSSPSPLSPYLNSTNDDFRRQEYVGYYVDPTSPSRYREADVLVPQIPAYHDLRHNARGIPQGLTRLRSYTSRSPSPSTMSRDRSISFYSAASAPSPKQAARQATTNRPHRHSGPIIVDGYSEASDYATPPESVFYPMASSEAASLSDDPPIDTPVTPLATTSSYDTIESFSLDAGTDNRMISSMPNILQFGDFPLQNTTRLGLISRMSDTQVENAPNPATPPRRGSKNMDTTSNALGFESHTANRSKESTMPTEQKKPPMPNGVPTIIPNLDLAGPPLNQDFSKLTLKPLPLLSPVREVRTPSPTATRSNPLEGSKSLHSRSMSALSNENHSSSPLSVMTNGIGKGKSIENLSPKSTPQVNGVVGGAHDGGSKVGLLQLQTSTWKEAGKKGKKVKGKGSISSVGEVVPDGVERKGG